MRPARSSDQEGASQGDGQEATSPAGSTGAEPPPACKREVRLPDPLPLGPVLLSLLTGPHRGLPSALL